MALSAELRQNYSNKKSGHSGREQKENDWKKSCFGISIELKLWKVNKKVETEWIYGREGIWGSKKKCELIETPMFWCGIKIIEFETQWEWKKHVDVIINIELHFQNKIFEI